MSHRDKVAAFIAAISAAAMATLLAPVAASAHDALISSNPKSGATLAAVPKSIVLTFEEPPAVGWTKAEVFGPLDQNISAGAAVTRGSVVTLAVHPSSATGAYTVRWSLLSDDGHPVSGTVAFTVAAKSKTATPKPTSAAAAAATVSTAGGAGAGWIVAVLVGAAGLAVVFRIGNVRAAARSPQSSYRPGR